jgi:hypothetical protein
VSFCCATPRDGCAGSRPAVPVDDERDEEPCRRPFDVDQPQHAPYNRKLVSPRRRLAEVSRCVKRLVSA